MRRILLTALVAGLVAGAPLAAQARGLGDFEASKLKKDKDKDKDNGPPVIALDDPGSGIELASDNLDCNLLTGCVFNGNDNDHAAPEIEEAYNEDHVEGPGPAILQLGEFIGKIDGINSQTYGWDLDDVDGWDGTAAKFVIVKSSGQFKLFQLTTADVIGDASGFIPQGQGFKDISHLSFYAGIASTVVPEPATWALMLLGFGAAGAVVRRRRDALASRL